MKLYNKHKSLEFNQLHKEISKIYYEIFLNKKNKKLYWYGIAALPLVVFTTAFVYKNKNLRNETINLKNYEERINIAYFNNDILKKKLKNFFYKIYEKIFFFSRKIHIIYSSNKDINNYCKNKNYLKLKFDPITYLNDKKINDEEIDLEFQKYLHKFIYKLKKNFFSKKKPNISFRKLEEKFVYFYKIYQIFLEINKKKRNNFLSGYSSIFYIRLYLASLMFFNKSKISSITHGNVEILNQNIDIIYDGLTLSTHSISKNKKFKLKQENFCKINKNIIYKPNLISLNYKFSSKKNKKKFISQKVKKILIIGYPYSKMKFSHQFSHINAQRMYETENDLINLLKKKYQIFYKAHPDSYLVLKSKIKIDKSKFIIDKFENVYEKYDCLIFSYHKSTALGFAILSNKPIFILKYRNLDLSKKDLNFFKKKFYFIDCYLDKGRLMVEKSSLIKKFRV